MSELIKHLMSLGLTNNESAVYLALCTHGDMTGYECAKHTGISRSNAYIALAGLCEKNAAFASNGEPQRYSPSPIREFCNDKRRALDASAEFLSANLPKPTRPSDAYVTINGNAIFNKMKNMISTCTERLYISAKPSILRQLSTELSQAQMRGLKVVVITESDYTQEGAVIYYAPRREGEIRLIVDSQSALTGDMSACLFSENAIFVTLFKDAMRNEILLIK